MIIVMSSSSRWTKQLKVIIDIIYSSEAPLSADEVYSRARERMPNISLGTVYRNLNKLVAEGLVSDTRQGSSQVFTRHPFPSAHFECVECKRLFPVQVELKNSELSKQAGMQVSRWTLRLSGVCRECEAKRT
jgi:Fur family peroxide stress response transcriptional regulator